MKTCRAVPTLTIMLHKPRDRFDRKDPTRATHLDLLLKILALFNVGRLDAQRRLLL